MREYPGAACITVDQEAITAFSPFDILLRITGGVTLSQICEMTGLESSTIQNWVKRGWVPRPTGKRYGEQHLARIFIINSLRGAMQLEAIIELLHYVNGNLNDTADDLLSDRALYDLFCQVLRMYDGGRSLESAVACALQGFQEPYGGAQHKLQTALSVMLPAYRSAQLKRQAEHAFRTIKGGQ